MDELKINDTVIKLVEGDITKQKVEAIVNAANSALAGGGGVDGAIHRAAGRNELLALTRPIGGCKTGSAVITTAGKMPLPVKYIIHAVGPVYHNGQRHEPELLAGAYQRSLELADEKKVESIAFPAISTGVYNYPMDAAAEVSFSTVIKYLQTHDGQVAPTTNLKEVQFVLFDHHAFHKFSIVLDKLAQ